MLRRDISRILMGTAAGTALVSVTTPAQATCTSACYPQITAETSAGVTPVDLSYPAPITYLISRSKE
jgi:hypothetical protein